MAKALLHRAMCVRAAVGAALFLRPTRCLPQGMVLGPVTLPLPPVSTKELQLGSDGQGTFCFPRQASEKDERRADPCRQPGRSGRAFPPMLTAVGSLLGVSRLSAPLCSSGPRAWERTAISSQPQACSSGFPEQCSLTTATSPESPMP